MKKEEDGMKTKRDWWRGLWAFAEILLAVVLGTFPMVTAESLGQKMNVSYLTLLSIVLQITSVTGIEHIAGEAWMIVAFYTAIMGAIIIGCIVLAVKAWKGRGKIQFLVINALAFLTAYLITMMVESIARSQMEWDTDIIQTGIGCHVTMILSIICLAFSIWNIVKSIMLHTSQKKKSE